MAWYNQVLQYGGMPFGALVGAATAILNSNRNKHLEAEKNAINKVAAGAQEIQALAAKETAEAQHIHSLNEIIDTYREELDRHKADREEMKKALEERIALLEQKINELTTANDTEKKELRAENAKLKDEVARLRKRVLHLERKEQSEAEATHLSTLDAEVRARKVG